MWVFREMGTNGIFAPALDLKLGGVENFPTLDISFVPSVLAWTPW